MTENQEEKYIPISMAARMLGISDQTLRRWVDEGHVECVFLPSGHRRFKESDIRKLLTRKEKN